MQDDTKQRSGLGLSGFFGVMIRVGSTGFGGPMALISMLQQHLVERRKAVTAEEFSEGVAIGQVLPGPIAVDAAIHVGYRLHGWLGAAAGACGLILPPFLIMLVLTPLYFHYGRVPQAQGFFAGVRPAVAAAIVAATVRLGKRGIKNRRGTFIAVLVFAWMLLRDQLGSWIEGFSAGSMVPRLYGWSGAVFLVFLSGILGMLFLRDAPEPGGRAGGAKQPGKGGQS